MTPARSAEGHTIHLAAPSCPYYGQRMTHALSRSAEGHTGRRVRMPDPDAPFIRVRILDDVAAHPGTTGAQVAQRLGMDRRHVSAMLSAMHARGTVHRDHVPGNVYQWAPVGVPIVLQNIPRPRPMIAPAVTNEDWRTDVLAVLSPTRSRSLTWIVCEMGWSVNRTRYVLACLRRAGLIYNTQGPKMMSRWRRV